MKYRMRWKLYTRYEEGEKIEFFKDEGLAISIQPVRRWSKDSGEVARNFIGTVPYVIIFKSKLWVAVLEQCHPALCEWFLEEHRTL